MVGAIREKSPVDTCSHHADSAQAAQRVIETAPMCRPVVFVLIMACECRGRMFCERSTTPLETGAWSPSLKHLDSAVVENGAVSAREGQVYVYENFFPGYVISYLHVDNVAMRSCGASAAVKSGGVGTSSVLIVLHAEKNEEIRSVVDIWGTKAPTAIADDHSNKRTVHIFSGLRTVNHNKGFKTFA